APGEPARGPRRLLAVLAGLGVLLALVLAVLVVTSGDDGGSSPNGGLSSTPAASSKPQSSTPAPPHGSTTVAVLNGTGVEGLANTVANELAADGFVRGPVTNASTPDRTVTVVSYFGGHEREAAEVAETLGVPSDAVQPINADTEASACPGGSATCEATVVVTVGADRQ
ncbi:MAG: LytR C-terminal domain-containing protein, partial [Conexibacter sp.]